METLLANLPFVLLLLLCPLMMMFMHRGDGHRGHDAADHAAHGVDAHSAEPVRPLPSSKDEATT